MLQAILSGSALRSRLQTINLGLRFRSSIATPRVMASEQKQYPSEGQTGAQAQIPVLSAHEERRWNRVSSILILCSSLLLFFMLLIVVH